MNRYFKYFLLLAFLSAIFVIVFLQFNSNRSINQLINGNENLLDELNLKSNLHQLQTNIVILESKVRGTVIHAQEIGSNHLQQEIYNIENSLQQVRQLQPDSLVIPLIDRLQQLVNEKVSFNKKVLDTFTINGKQAAEEIINKQTGTILTDSIRILSAKADSLHQLAVTSLTRKADADGRRARALGTLMALIAAMASIITFGYVAYRIREQQLLISRLNESEKKAKEAAAVKENFLANMSHEIRTPLNAILGFTNLLERNELDPRSGEYVQTIRKSGENLLAIVDDILDLSKIEAGMMRIEPAPFSIRNLLQTTEAMFKEKANDKNLNAEYLIQDSIPDILIGDAMRLTQILTNLIGNAIKFTEKGGVTVSLTNGGIAAGRILLGITVADTGIGIGKEKLPEVFDRFHQAEESVTRKYGGTGLGLSIVKELVHLLDGTISVQSEPGKGTTFKLSVPYKFSMQQADTPVTGSLSETPEAAFNGIRILVVEDNELNQTLIRHLFNQWKLGYDIANNGNEAISMLQRQKYQLVLMDIQMPGVDGYTTTQQIRNDLNLTIPVIAMTAHALPGEREKCLSYGMNEYLPKPINETRLRQLIETFTGFSKEVLPAGKKQPAETNYQYIDLGYMKEVSNGNTAYEKAVTEQFIEAIPLELAAIENTFRIFGQDKTRQLAHNMKTTVSVMGLNEALRPYLDAIEQGQLTEETFQYHFNSLESICQLALAEAKRFYTSLPSGN
jgi:signal transduction histidine kinase/CheY-like chemotaxis protein